MGRALILELGDVAQKILRTLHCYIRISNNKPWNRPEKPH